MSARTSAVIVGIDGTIAPHDGIRGHFEYERVGEDEPVFAIVRLVQMLAAHHRIVFFSGREDSRRAATAAWLERHGLGGDDLLLLRAAGETPRRRS